MMMMMMPLPLSLFESDCDAAQRCGCEDVRNCGPVRRSRQHRQGWIRGEGLGRHHGGACIMGGLASPCEQLVHAAIVGYHQWQWPQSPVYEVRELVGAYVPVVAVPVRRQSEKVLLRQRARQQQWTEHRYENQPQPGRGGGRSEDGGGLRSTRRTMLAEPRCIS